MLKINKSELFCSDLLLCILFTIFTDTSKLFPVFQRSKSIKSNSVFNLQKVAENSNSLSRDRSELCGQSKYREKSSRVQRIENTETSQNKEKNFDGITVLENFWRCCVVPLRRDRDKRLKEYTVIPTRRKINLTIFPTSLFYLRLCESRTYTYSGVLGNFNRITMPRV